MNCKLKKIISLLCMIGWMGVIFLFSAQPSHKSSQMSLNIGRLVGKLVISDYKQLSKDEQDIFAKNIEYGVRKIAHLSEYAILGGLIFWTVITWIENKKKYVFFSVIFGAFYAATDEFHQLFVLGRSGRITDVFIDTVGVVMGVLCAYEFFYRMKQWKKTV